MEKLTVYDEENDTTTVFGKALCEQLAERLDELKKQGVTKPVIIIDEILYKGMMGWLKDKLQSVEVHTSDLKGFSDPRTGASFNDRPIIVTFLGLECPKII